MSKIALALIVKGSDDEAKFLERCLADVAPFVDGVFITSTYTAGNATHQGIDEIAKDYKAHISYFEWVNDFSKARNFNWSQVPKEYDYILWCDADDTFRNLVELRKLIEAHPEVDAWTMQYYYDKDESGNPTVIHTKTQVVRNDGCTTWVNRIHEDFKETRSLNVRYTDDIKRLHGTTETHSEEAKKRNLEIAEAEALDNPDDPHVYFNLGNSHFGLGDAHRAKLAYQRFLETSNSEAEKYVVLQRLAAAEKILGHKAKAIQYLQTSIGMFPEFPDAINQLGYMYFDYGMLDEAERYLLIGLMTKPQYHKMIVYNPRDYDYNPMMALAKLYFQKSRPDLALPMLRGCSQIYPNDKKLASLVEEMERENKRLEAVVEKVKYIESLGDNKEKVMYELNKIPNDLQSHPALCAIRNKFDVKTESSGKDIVYYCSETQFEWNPELFKTKGFGGSEEAVVNLAKEWAKLGYNVTVYNSCGTTPMVADGVTYKPWWTFNARDKVDHLIIWRSAKLADYDINATNIYVDLHDVIPEGEFTEKRLAKIKKIFVKTKAHRVLFPNVPDEKFVIIPNGMDFGLFNQDIEKDPYLLVNTSSPDRSMDVLPKLFTEVKKRVPAARLKWAYGWDNFVKWHGSDKRMMDWMEKIKAEMTEAGIEDCGRLPQKECAKLYLEGTILAYPSDFYEIDCITVKKAQACGCIPVTTDFAAMPESNKYGVQVKTDRNKDNWALPYQIGFGTKYTPAQMAWVDEVVRLLTRKDKNMQEFVNMTQWVKRFEWPKVASEWVEIFS